jgi:alpha-1,3/alpha-1,6-mannosyltransferase
MVPLRCFLILDPRVTENVEHLEELNTLASSLSLKAHTWSLSPTPASTDVLFLPSFSTTQRSFLLASAVCLVYTPSGEHFGIVPLEAMYAGVPVIAVNHGGPTETVVHGVTGLLCDAEETAFADAILKLTGDARVCRDMGLEGRDLVKREFSAAKYADALEGLLEDTMAARNNLNVVVFLGVAIPVLVSVLWSI